MSARVEGQGWKTLLMEGLSDCGWHELALGSHITQDSLRSAQIIAFFHWLFILSCPLLLLFHELVLQRNLF